MRDVKHEAGDGHIGRGSGVPSRVEDSLKLRYWSKMGRQRLKGKQLSCW